MESTSDHCAEYESFVRVSALARYRDHFPVIHLRCTPGLSRARNLGLREANGDVISFPDDDCWFPPGLLHQVFRYLENDTDIDGLTGRLIAEDDTVPTGRFGNRPGVLTNMTVWTRGISTAIFLRRCVIEAVGPFDERLGVGANTGFGAGEETDFLLRAIAGGLRILYDPVIRVGHPKTQIDADPTLPRKVFGYGVGMGHVLRRHRFPWYFTLYFLARPFGGAIVSVLRRQPVRVRYYIASGHGRLVGWLSRMSS